MFATLQTLILAGAGLFLAFLVCLSLPQSKLRDFLFPIAGWGSALGCGAYICLPADCLPEILLGPAGLVDDAGALVAGILAARSAMHAARHPSAN